MDNLSDDGTGDYLAKQDDVSAFASRDNFARAQSGMRWVNELIRRYGDDNWCIFVDADEELVLPEGASLRAFVDGMAARGEEVLPAFMVDTFPADLAALRDFGPGDAPGDLPNLMDTDYFVSGNRFCPFLRVRGGARQRLFGSREHLEKAPILRGGMGPSEIRRLYRSNHGINYARVSARRGVLLHHKLLREALEMLPNKANLQRTESRMRLDQWRHEHYRNSGYLSAAAEIPRGPATVAYKSPAQLHRLGLLDDLQSASSSRR